MSGSSKSRWSLFPARPLVPPTPPGFLGSSPRLPFFFFFPNPILFPLYSEPPGAASPPPWNFSRLERWRRNPSLRRWNPAQVRGSQEEKIWEFFLLWSLPEFFRSWNLGLCGSDRQKTWEKKEFPLFSKPQLEFFSFPKPKWNFSHFPNPKWNFFPLSTPQVFGFLCPGKGTFLSHSSKSHGIFRIFDDYLIYPPGIWAGSCWIFPVGVQILLFLGLDLQEKSKEKGEGFPIPQVGEIPRRSWDMNHRKNRN